MVSTLHILPASIRRKRVVVGTTTRLTFDTIRRGLCAVRHKMTENQWHAVKIDIQIDVNTDTRMGRMGAAKQLVFRIMRIPGYEIESKLGQGGMAVVYLAVQ